MIAAQNLTKWYGPVQAIAGISFHIEPGQIVGFLGPNGAGKSTTIRILTGYLPPTSGTATVAGVDVLKQSREARAKIGYLPESTPLYPEMRVEEFLHFRGKLYAMPRKLRRQRIDAVADRCGLAQIRRRVIGQLSKGNRQRVGIAQALLHDPPVLILDEPTAGLDPIQIGHVRELLRDLAGKHTILLSSHILPEVEKTADRVMIVARGRIVASGTPDELRRHVARGGALVVEAKADAAALSTALRGVPKVQEVQVAQRDGWSRATVTTEGGADAREPLAAAVAAKGWPLREVRYESASLEEYFVQITAEQDRAA